MTWRRCGWLWLLILATGITVIMLMGSVALAPAVPVEVVEAGGVAGPSASLTTSTRSTTEAPGPCGRLLLDHWDAGKPFKVVLLAVDNQGGRFGNELFSVAAGLVQAQRSQRPVLLHRPSIDKRRQILRLPCLRSSAGVARQAQEICHGCAEEKIWEDRSGTCNRGQGCLEKLRSKGHVQVLGGDPFHQDLAEWKEPPLVWRPLLREAFQVEMPQLKEPVPMPNSTDLVLYFRCYRKAQVFDLHGGTAFLSGVPFAFFEHAVLQHQQEYPAASVWVMADPSMRTHPTVKRLEKELKALVFTAMDQAKKDAWLADWVWLREAKHLAMSPSTFVWWAAFLGEAERIYVPILPGLIGLPWCKLLPEDPRFRFYDIWTNTSYNEASVAKSHCQKYTQCKEGCPVKEQRLRVAELYPELLELQHWQDQEYLASADKTESRIGRAWREQEARLEAIATRNKKLRP
ncbi:unnamed protein product [Durusdinium trenchii]|uniref:Uncharacterized protein n=1 Tax=Durusdinium trenchii TaxID=1381693 RepID=A0ABP0NP86_9DINO